MGKQYTPLSAGEREQISRGLAVPAVDFALEGLQSIVRKLNGDWL